MNLHFHIAEVNVIVHDDKMIAAILERTKTIDQKLKTILMTNEELLAKLTGANAKVDKVITEIKALKDLVTTTPDVPQNIVDAVTTLESKLQQADDENEDAAPTEETPA